MAPLRTAYDPTALQPAGPNTSRFLRRHTPAGWPKDEDETLAHTLRDLVNERTREATDIDASVTLELQYVRRRSDRTYELVSRGTLIGTPTREPVTRKKRKTSAHEGGDLIDRFALGDPDVFKSATDDEIWAALLHLSESARLDERPLRNVNDDIARLIALRHGLAVAPHELPQEMLVH